MFDNEYVQNLLDKACEIKESNKLEYIKHKVSNKGIEHLSILEYNYIRRINDLPEISIYKLKNILYENYISYSDIQKKTKISRAMVCMILRGNRNCTIKALKLLMKCITDINKKIKFEDIIW